MLTCSDPTTLPSLIAVNCLPASVILDAELAAEAADVDSAEFADVTSDDDAMLCDAVDKHLSMLVEWARHLPPFIHLPLSDQVSLLRSGQGNDNDNTYWLRSFSNLD